MLKLVLKINLASSGEVGDTISIQFISKNAAAVLFLSYSTDGYYSWVACPAVPIPAWSASPAPIRPSTRNINYVFITRANSKRPPFQFYFLPLQISINWQLSNKSVLELHKCKIISAIWGQIIYLLHQCIIEGRSQDTKTFAFPIGRRLVSLKLVHT